MAASAGRAVPSCGSRRTLASAGDAGVAGEAGSQRLPFILGAAGAAAGACGLAYWAAFGKVEEVNIPIQNISDDVFDSKDNLFVIFLDKPEDLLDRKADIQRLARILKGEQALHRLSMYFNVRKEGDPPVPEGSGPDSQDLGQPPPLRCVMYKGSRKAVIKVGAEVQVDKIIEFYSALSEKKDEAWAKYPVQRVSGQSFAQEVLAVSSPASPVLLQMYEDTCFLCFLMRPFVNSLAKLFNDNKVPLTFKRINIDKNDFPDRCPVARGTPTFVYFAGDQVPGRKWEEFKPKDLVERLAKEYTNLPDSVMEEMDVLQGLVSRRFQLFTQLVMWTIEMQKLETLVAGPAPLLKPDQGTDEASEVKKPEESQDEDTAFGAVVADMMAKDMRRTDLLHENLLHLQREVDEVEHDAALLGMMLAESVLKREKEEDELFAAARRGRTPSR